MSLITQSHCPNCNNELPFVKVWWYANTTRGIFLRETTGVVCPACKTKLVILQARVVIANLVISFGGLGLALYSLIFLEERLRHKLSQGALLFGLLPCVLLMVLAQNRIAPLFARVRRPEHGESVKFPLERLKTDEVDAELDREYLEEERRLEEINDPSRTEWTCPQCSAQNPSTFDMCWKCNAIRDQESKNSAKVGGSNKAHR